MAAARGYRTITVELKNQSVSVYTSPKVADALEQLSSSMTVYEGVKLGQLLEAAYNQGKKDGARSVFELVDDAKKEIPHRRPGRPKGS